MDNYPFIVFNYPPHIYQQICLIVVKLAKIVDINQKDSLKIKPVRSREYLADNKCQNIPAPIPTEQELDNILKLDDSSLDKTLINNQSISSENSEKKYGRSTALKFENQDFNFFASIKMFIRLNITKLYFV